MLKNSADDRALFNEGNDLHLSSAAATSQGIHLVDLLDESSPVASALAGVMLGGRVGLGRSVDSSIQGHREGLFSPLAARGVGIAAVVADHLLVGVGDVGGD